MSINQEINQAVDTFLTVSQSPYTSDELHGLLSGFIVAGGVSDKAALQQLEVEFNINHQLERDRLNQLQQLLLQDLDSDQFNFSMPFNESDPFEEQLAAFIKWCEGFLAGFAFVPSTNQIEASIQSFLQDIVAFSQLDTENIDEDAERDFYELTEYLRLGVINLFLDQKKAGLSRNNNQQQKKSVDSSILPNKYFH